MIFKKEETKEAAENPRRTEFNERVTHILLAVCKGMSAWVPAKDPLKNKIDELFKVLKKVARPKPPTGIAQEILEFFAKTNLEDKAKGFERGNVRAFIAELGQVIGKMSHSSGGINREMGGMIHDFESLADNGKLDVLKARIIEGLVKIREESGQMEKELARYREKTASLAKRLEETESLGFTDRLTHTLNRHAFETQVGQWFPDGKSNGEPVGFVFIDVDNFKSFNDTHGHQVGDLVLRFVADTLREGMGEDGKLFRYGGEEFLVLVPGKDLEAVAKVSEQTRRLLEKDYFVDKNRKLQVTVSMGVTLSKKGELLEEVLERADKALYSSKEKGRNRVTVSP